jgi:hypothetical protein
MTFFNKKTEVMQVQMTPYGRYLYSIGKFKPHSYEFVDDDVIYKVSGSTEAQEAAHNRIVSETPKIRPIVSHTIVDNAYDKNNLFIDEKREMNIRLNKPQSMISKLGNSSFSSNKTPSFQINMLKGKIKHSSKYQEKDNSYIQIPRVFLQSQVVAFLRDELLEPSFGRELVSSVNSSGEYYEVEYDDYLMELKEMGSFYEKENFEIEVFMSGSDGNYTKLKFENNKQLIRDGILEEARPQESETLLESEFAFDDPTYVNYYFDIDVDDEISKVEMCELVDQIEIIDPLLDDQIDCPDIRTERFDIYQTRVGPEDLEDC